LSSEPAVSAPDSLPVWPARRNAAREGIRAVAPTLIATGAWGLVTGVAMVKSGLAESMALLMTLALYAGSTQLTSLPLIASGAPLWLIFAAGFIVNLRFLIFGAALHPFFRHLSWPRRLALGYFTSDISFVLFIPRYGDARLRGTREQIWFFIGVIAPGWFVWQGTSIAGIYLGALVPAAWSLDFAAVLALLAMVVPLATTRPMLAAIAAAAATAWVGQLFPLRLGLVAAVVAGVAAGILAERYARSDRRARAAARPPEGRASSLGEGSRSDRRAP
jgi:predicted branched-subunit amino acid permease